MRKRRFDTFLGFTQLWSKNCVATKGDFAMIFVNLVKKRMPVIISFFLNISFIESKNKFVEITQFQKAQSIFVKSFG